MQSKIAIAGHPLHPMLVPLPIGMFVASVVADIAYLLTDRDHMWYDIAFWTLIFGIVSGLVAALAGFGDFWLVARYTDARELTTAHMLMNVAALVLFFVSLILRLNDGALQGGRFGAAFALSLVAITVLSISGWLGGEMSYRKHLGMVPDSRDDEFRERERHVVHS